ncbi:MAG: tRNA 2-selenouridine(34) synthase MnmH [Burkholderiales bacterium]|nr:tRNA 2-selenouridine(34) synthase MnmH [Burkholderiales bacterium]
MASSDLVTVAQLNEFDEIIDARSPAEFSVDHIPGALNFPVLSDDERAQVGLLYSASAFRAKKIGAALVARNIAHHLENSFVDKPKGWRPLIYCWRGGARSDAFTHILRQVGWNARRLHGGYKAYRRAVVADLQTLPADFDWRVICGLTGSGKSLLLQALAAHGAQVLDLEQLAAHRGSVLGQMPDQAQPTQKKFDSCVWSALCGFSASQPVYVEAESRKIGNLRVPESLIASIWQAPCIRLEAPIELRVQLLQREYAHFLQNVAALNAKLQCLTTLYGHAVIDRWAALAQNSEWDVLVQELLERHYDLAYLRSTLTHYQRYDECIKIHAAGIQAANFKELAISLLKDESDIAGITETTCP